MYVCVYLERRRGGEKEKEAKTERIVWKPKNCVYTYLKCNVKEMTILIKIQLYKKINPIPLFYDMF